MPEARTGLTYQLRLALEPECLENLTATARENTQRWSGLDQRHSSCFIGSFLDAGEIDEFVISVVPVFIGEGIPLIAPGRRTVAETDLQQEVHRRRGQAALWPFRSNLHARLQN